MKDEPAPSISDEPEDATEAELEFRALLVNRGEYGKWAKQVRAAWAASPAGILAARLCESRTNSRRRVGAKE